MPSDFVRQAEERSTVLAVRMQPTGSLILDNIVLYCLILKYYTRQRISRIEAYHLAKSHCV